MYIYIYIYMYTTEHEKIMSKNLCSMNTTFCLASFH